MTAKYYEITMVIETNHIEDADQLSNLLDFLKIKEKRISQSAVTDCREVKEFPSNTFNYRE